MRPSTSKYVRWSLRTACLSFVVVGAVLAWCRATVRRYALQTAAIDRLAAASDRSWEDFVFQNSNYEPPLEPDLDFLRWLPQDRSVRFMDVVSLYFYADQLPGAMDDLRLLPELRAIAVAGMVDGNTLSALAAAVPQLKSFEFDIGPSTSDGLSQLRAFRNLERLELSIDGEASLPLSAALDGSGVKSLRIHGSFPDSLVHDIGRIGQLRELQLVSGTATDVDIQALCALTRLEKLELYCPKLTDVGVRSLNALTGLVTLSIHSRLVTDRAFQDNPALSNVRHLYLSSSNCGDGALRSVCPSGKLAKIAVGPLTTSDGVAALLSCPGLTHVCLRNSQVSLQETTVFESLRSLRVLDVSNTRFGDDDVDAVLRIHGLKEIVVPRTKVTNAGKAKLRASGITVID